MLFNKRKHINAGRIRIDFDNRLSHRKIVKSMLKPSIYTQDSGAEIARIKTIMKEALFRIELILVRGHVAPRQPCHQQPLQHLIIECDEKAWKARENIHNCATVTNIKHAGEYALKQEQRVVSRSLKEAIRIVDRRKSE